MAVISCASGPQQGASYAPSYTVSSLRSRSLVKLPSIGEFDLGVEELARTHGLFYPWIPSSPLLDAKNRHINQKYTTEEGDFIIYAWHDRKMKWQRIREEFATLFGRTPERTVQGLQAWYYRMNQRIPVWDNDGWLCFENEDDQEPKHISLKRRERESQDKPTAPLGLAQRYPERAIRYSWVDTELKFKAKGWGKHHPPQNLSDRC